jgi:UDP-glucose 4-epimerase
VGNRVVVTGGAGFIGSNLVDRLLASGTEVLVVDNLATGHMRNLHLAENQSGFAFEQADITDETTSGLIASFHPDVVFHLAAQADVRVSVADPVFDATVNVLGTLNVLRGAVEGGARRFVAAASGGTLYGEVDPRNLPIVETTPWCPLAPYGISKKVMIDYLRSAQSLHGIATMSLALGNVFGPRQDPHGEAGVIAIFFQQYLAGLTPTVFGTGDQTRDFIYVDDVTAAFSAASLVAGNGELINIGTGLETSVNDLIRSLNALTGRDVQPHIAPARPGELDRSVLDISLANRLLDWQPEVGIAEGLSRTWEWFTGPLGATAIA